MIFLSPGVKTREVDYSTYVGQTSSCIVGIVGGGRKGPIGQATLCTSPANFVEQFGEPLPSDFGAQAAIQFLLQGNQLYYVREVETSAAEATGVLSNGLISVRAKEVGTYFNTFAVAITDVKENTFKISVYKDNHLDESFEASLDPTAENFIENIDSHWVEFEYTEDLSNQLPEIVGFTGASFTRNSDNVWHLKKDVSAPSMAGLTFSVNEKVAATSLLWKEDTQTADGTYTQATPETAAGDTVLSDTSFTVTFGDPLDFTKGPWKKRFTIALQTANGLETVEEILIEAVAAGESTITDNSGTAPSTVVNSKVALAASTTVLSGGNDGLPLTPKTVIGSGTSGLQAFTNADSVDVNLIAAPGFWEESVVNEMINICKNRADCFAIIDPPQGLSVQDVLAYHNGTLQGEGYPRAALNTSYAAIFYPWVQIHDRYSGEKIWCPPSGVVLAQFAYNDAVGQPWFAAAGLNRGMLTTVLATERELSAGDRDALYGNGNAVNAIVNYKRQGITIWGQRTLQRKSSALDRINVRRLLNMVRKAVAISSAYMVFEQNDPLTWRQWKGTVDPYLESIKNSRGLYDYLTIMDETTVTAFHQDRNEMPGKVFLKATKSAEFIPVDFVLTSSGAIFGEDE